MTSLTPVMTTATSAPNGGALERAEAWTPRVVSPVRARKRPLDAPPGRAVQRSHQVADDRLLLARDADAGGRRIAGDEQAQRRRAPPPTLPSRAPSASGSTGARRRVASACATSSGASASLSASAAPAGRSPRGSTAQKLREVGLALLEEGAERFLRFGALQALRRRSRPRRRSSRAPPRRGRAASAAWSRARRRAAGH